MSQEGGGTSKINTNFRPRQWRSFRSDSLKQPEEADGQAANAEEPVVGKRTTGLVRRMASQILSASSSASKSASTSQIGGVVKENSTFKTAVEDLKKVMNSQEFKQLNASIYSEVARRKESPVAAVKNKLTELNGSFHLEESEKGIKIRVRPPHLVISSTAERAANAATKTSIRIYPLRLGRTTVGASASSDIVLSGAGIEDEHCYFENVLITDTTDQDAAAKSQTDQSKKLVNLVTLYPLAQLCAVDGVLIDHPYRLNCGKFQPASARLGSARLGSVM